MHICELNWYSLDKNDKKGFHKMGRVYSWWAWSTFNQISLERVDWGC